ncbi:uncharacterized protein [Physcomitrium patens]|uniref:DUF1475 domain-containing protein n=1 Tax=Physcomitrium patens TaxID=3218 RepID=A0A7I4C549_PHYPA|nr:uncharacterized protein LOC112273963 isoform X2 [Physcomitrium patens]|eukprot:XP_024358836.1 uncharacterized protein LOC112273963 isoform X2 [Physcomitrella patens]
MATSVVAGRFIFLVLGFATACTVLYTCVTDGSPFRMELLTPWMSATLIDFYVNVIPIAAWVWYKESNLGSRVTWTVLLICFGSITTCWYIAIEFFKMSPDDPAYYVLLKDRTIRKGGRVAAN